MWSITTRLKLQVLLLSGAKSGTLLELYLHVFCGFLDLENPSDIFLSQVPRLASWYPMALSTLTHLFRVSEKPQSRFNFHSFMQLLLGDFGPLRVFLYSLPCHTLSAFSTSPMEDSITLIPLYLSWIEIYNSMHGGVVFSPTWDESCTPLITILEAFLCCWFIREDNFLGLLPSQAESFTGLDLALRDSALFHFTSGLTLSLLAQYLTPTLNLLVLFFSSNCTFPFHLCFSFSFFIEYLR